MRMRVHYIYIYIAALLCVACSSESLVEDITPLTPDSDDPIVFTGVSEAAMTRANAMPSNMLRSGFVVSTYKNFGNTNWSAELHTVMPRYKVDYSENRDDWNGVVVSNWNYININNPWTGVRQEEKFWDYSGFPYRFHAVAPANGNNLDYNQIEKLDYNELSIINAPYIAQTFEAPSAPTVPFSGSLSPSLTPSNQDAEPYIVAQVSRNANGQDMDIIKNIEINKETTSRNRRVWLPFHHLNCKVRFGIYTDNLLQTDRVDYIKDLTIWAERLATEATGYKAYGSDAWLTKSGFSYFTGISVTNGRVDLIKYNWTETDATSDRTYEQNNLSLHQGKSSAYFLECPEGLMQLPQNEVKLHISMTIVGRNGEETAYFHDYEITKEAGNTVDPTHWQAGYIHTYYIHLNFDNLMLPIITTTCTLTPWEDIYGNLSTDLEQ